MRGSVALRAALGLWWSATSPSSSFVDALAIEPVATGAVPPEDIRVVTPEARGEDAVDALPSQDADTAKAYISFDLADPVVTDDDEPLADYTLVLEIAHADTSCGPSNISLSAHPLPTNDDGIGHGSFVPSSDNDLVLPFEASWSVNCLPAATEGSEPSQLLHFDITSVSGRAVDAGLLSFVAQFRPHTKPVEILSVAGSAASVRFEGAFTVTGPHADERDKSLLADIARLEALRHRLVDIEDAIVTLEHHIADSYGVDVETLGIGGAKSADDNCQEHRVKCTVNKVVHTVSGTAKKLYGELFGHSDEDAEHETTTVFRPKSGSEHPIVASPHGHAPHTTTASVPAKTSNVIIPETAEASVAMYEASTPSPSDHSMSHEHMTVFLPAAVMIFAIAFILLRARRHRQHSKETPDEETGFFGRMRARRRRRQAKEQRAEAVKSAIRAFFRHVFRVPHPTDAEKEAERQLILQNLNASRPRQQPQHPLGPSWVTLDLERAGAADAFAVGSEDDDEPTPPPAPVAHYARRTRPAHDAESITLVGSERGDDADADSDSEGSTTMEMDLARFREATFMVGDMVSARAGGSVSAPPRRPPSPAASLPGYASDDPYPTSWEGADDDDDERPVADGFMYRPGDASRGPRASLDVKTELGLSHI